MTLWLILLAELRLIYSQLHSLTGESYTVKRIADSLEKTYPRAFQQHLDSIDDFTKRHRGDRTFMNPSSEKSSSQV